MNKKKLLIIYPQLDTPYSGGQVIDFEFINMLKESQRFHCDYILDSTCGKGSIMDYICYSILHINSISKYDVIFTNSRLYPRLFFCFLLLKLFCCKCNVIVYHHHFNFYTQKGLLYYIHKFFELTFLKLTKTVILPSPYTKKEMEMLLPMVNTRYIEIGFKLQPILDLKKCKPRNLLTVGTVENRKRIHQIVPIVKFLRDECVNFHINIVGKIADSAYFNKIMQEIDDENLNNYITFYGRISNECLEECYQKADIFLFPSSHEGYGMVLIEAMSYSLPIVAYRNSAIPYTVNDGIDGLLANDGNVMELSSKIKTLLTDDKLWARLRRGAYNHSLEVVSLESMREQMKNYISEL